MAKIKLEWVETVIYKDDDDNKSIGFNEYFTGDSIEDCINEAAENYDWKDHFEIYQDREEHPPIEIYRDLRNIFVDNNGVWEDADIGLYNSWEKVVETAMAREDIFEKTRP